MKLWLIGRALTVHKFLVSWWLLFKQHGWVMVAVSWLLDYPKHLSPICAQWSRIKVNKIEYKTEFPDHILQHSMLWLPYSISLSPIFSLTSTSSPSTPLFLKNILFSISTSIHHITKNWYIYPVVSSSLALHVAFQYHRHWQEEV